MEIEKTTGRYASSEHWVAFPVLVHDGPVRTWDDVMVRPEDAASLGVPGFTVSLFCPGEDPVDDDDREAKALLDGSPSGHHVDPEAMSVLIADPFVRQAVMLWVAECLRLAEIPLASLREVEHDEFFAGLPGAPPARGGR